MEVVDIDLDNIPLSNDISSEIPSEKPSVSFGGGIELLMNEKKKSSNSSTKIDLEELDNLESELNDLSSTAQTSAPAESAKTLNGLAGFGNMFGFGEKKKEPESFRVNDSSLGQATKESTPSASRTWDGFSKVGDDIPKKEIKSSANLSEREKRRKKRLMIKKLEEWAEKGLHKNGSHFNMDSDFDEVEDEYETALEEKRKKDSIKLQGWWFTTAVSTLEYGNAFLNPFDLNLDGWGEQVSEDLDSYEEIFAELHEKYKGGKMAPEVSLLLRIGFSAAVVNMSNKMLSSATPGFNDVIKQSPELMKMFSNAAVDTMSKQNSAFDFAKNMMSPPEEVNTSFGPPPAAVKTKNQAPPQRPGSMQFTPHPGNRPDLTAAANNNPMFRESGVDLNNNAQNIHEPPKSIPTVRPEMKGPQTTPELDQLLSGLKPKPQTAPSAPITAPPPVPPAVEEVPLRGADSMISVSSLRDLEGTSMPKRTKKRQNNSNKNTISLDL